ncbi:hypothetical protein NQ117_07060 [Paenibacillus sp. SC116]|uniref:hypothetical protein n=1 Tax=Paenibacillus sp. SC116 TaxID=2968986 RepID=UPI00215A3C76|nr:hypothetical protein [Paenibacillus sp. SC116]MCR8843438.1 hypothetical protein [Paenibacillus sp. SC116]
MNIDCGTSNGAGCIKTSWLKLETWVYKYSNDTGSVQARFEWLNKPYYTDEDVLAIGLNSNFSPTPGSETANYKFDRWNPIDRVFNTMTVTYSTATRDVGGYGFAINLGDMHDINHRGYMSYQFSRRQKDVLLADAFAHYAHQESTFSFSPSFSIPWGGSLAIEQQSKFDIVKAHAQLKPWY